MDTPFLTPLGLLFLLCISDPKKKTFADDHLMNIPTKFDSNWPSGFLKYKSFGPDELKMRSWYMSIILVYLIQLTDTPKGAEYTLQIGEHIYSLNTP